MEIEKALGMKLFEKTLMNANYSENCLIEKVFLKISPYFLRKIIF